VKSNAKKAVDGRPDDVIGAPVWKAATAATATTATNRYGLSTNAPQK
jgi:hypothetical protein